MPTYEYKCNSCGKLFEHFQSIKEEPLKTCLCSKQGEVQRIISKGAGIIFKGSGFYVNDYKKSTPNPTDSETKSTPTSTSSETKSTPTSTSSETKSTPTSTSSETKSTPTSTSSETKSTPT